MAPFSSYDTSDQELIAQILAAGRTGREGEDRLFSQYSYFMREGRKKFGLSEDGAFDAYSDAVLSTLQTIRQGRFEGRSSLKTYLFQVFHNKCVDQVRKNATNKGQVNHTVELTAMFQSLSDTARSILQRLIDKSDIAVLREKLKELGDNCRKMLMLHAEGFSDREIAKELQYRTAEVVKTSRLRCLEKLRSLYKIES